MEGPSVFLTYDELCAFHSELSGSLVTLETELRRSGTEYDPEELWSVADDCWKRLDASISHHARTHEEPELLKAPDFLVLDLLPRLAKENRMVREKIDALRLRTRNALRPR